MPVWPVIMAFKAKCNVQLAVNALDVIWNLIFGHFINCTKKIYFVILHASPTPNVCCYTNNPSKQLWWDRGCWHGQGYRCTVTWLQELWKNNDLMNPRIKNYPNYYSIYALLGSYHCIFPQAYDKLKTWCNQMWNWECRNAVEQYQEMCIWLGKLRGKQESCGLHRKLSVQWMNISDNWRKEELQKTEEQIEKSHRQGQLGMSWEHMCKRTGCFDIMDMDVGWKLNHRIQNIFFDDSKGNIIVE